MKHYFLTLLALAFAANLFAQTPGADIRNMERRSKTSDELPFDPALFPFYHGVASGDPANDGFVIWTRVTPDEDAPVNVAWRVATDTALAEVVAEGAFETNADRDYTVKVEVTGLNAGTTYYYGFTALDAHSLTGRAKTLPEGSPEHLRFAFVSCQNYEAGYYNAFGRIADRNDLDAVIHLGDYIYEYAPGEYGSEEIDRAHLPEAEIIALEDYRTRYSLYRLDPDLRRAHQQHPFIAIWDDHEYTNDAWKDGAENHQPDTEGEWADRVAAAKQAYFEWTPIRDNAEQSVYRAFNYGGLADLIMLDTRLEGRTQQPDSISAPDFESEDPSRYLMSDEQKNWFADALANSQAKFKIVGNQVIFSELNVGFFSPEDPDSSENVFLDIWDGYPAERRRIVDFINQNEIDNVIFLTGDFHSTFAFDVALDAMNPESYNAETGEGSVAVEFATPSISSANFDENVGEGLAILIESIINKPNPQAGGLNFNPHMKNVDLMRHGYAILDVKDGGVEGAERATAQADWFYVEDILTVTEEEELDGSFATFDGDNFLTEAAEASTEKAVQDLPAPQNPPLFVNRAELAKRNVNILSVSPNPFNRALQFEYVLTEAASVEISIFSVSGQKVAQIAAAEQTPGFYDVAYDATALPSGAYVLQINAGGKVQTRKIIKQ